MGTRLTTLDAFADDHRQHAGKQPGTWAAIYPPLEHAP
jgi:hypothetical protein